VRYIVTNLGGTTEAKSFRPILDEVTFLLLLNKEAFLMEILHIPERKRRSGEPMRHLRCGNRL